MSKSRLSRLRFNLGFLLEMPIGSSRTYELDYPSVQVSEDVELTPLRGAMTASRISDGIFVNGRLHSTITVECVRCLEDAIVPLELDIDEMFYYPPASAPPGELVVGENGFIDLAPLVRELALLSVPMQPLCRTDCQGLCMICGQNLNEGDCDCEEDNVDPRLAALKELLD